MSLTRSQLNALRSQNFTPLLGKPVRICSYCKSGSTQFDDTYSWIAGFIVSQNSHSIHVSISGQGVGIPINRNLIMNIVFD